MVAATVDRLDDLLGIELAASMVSLWVVWKAFSSAAMTVALMGFL